MFGFPTLADALGELADPRAIPHREPLLTDRTEAWPIDNHGPMLLAPTLPTPPSAASAANPP